MARATMDITFQCPGKNVRPSIKIFFFKKRAILDQGLALHFSYRNFFLLFRYPSVCSIVIDFLREKNATLFISAMGKIY